MRRLPLVATLLLGCTQGRPAPEALRPGDDACAHCRMAVSDPKFASQVARRGALPEFFDDHGCLVGRLRARPLEAGAAAYVADHESGRWVEASAAGFVRAPTVKTPMSSGLLAYATMEAARAAAVDLGGEALTLAQLVAGSSPVSAAGSRGTAP